MIYFITVSIRTIQIVCACLPYFSFQHRKNYFSVICVIMKSVRTWKQLCNGILNYINQHNRWVTYLHNRHYGVYCGSFLVNHWKITIIIKTKYPPLPQRAQQPLIDHSLLIIEVAWYHSDTPHSLGLLWTSDQPDVEPLPKKTQQCREIHIHELDGIQTRNPNKRAAANSHLRQRGHWDRPHSVFTSYIFHVNTPYSKLQMVLTTENVFSVL